jgi:phospholipid/cholesterol/gamma-HCH transport system substrate-binding protein
MRSFRDRNPYAVGLVSVAVIGLLTGVAFAVGLLHLLEKAYEMRAVFSDASGLKRGDSVDLAGIQVGRVTDIEVDRSNGTVVVTFVVNDGTHLGTDTRAEIALETLLGAKHIRLATAAEEPYLEDLDSDDAERTIPIERTDVPYDLFKLTRVGTESIEALHTEELNAFITDLADITEGKRQQITDLVRGLDAVSSAITERDAELRSLLDRADTLSATLADKDDELVRLIDASQRILELIVERRDQLAIALGDGADAVAQLTRIITEHKAELDNILDTLHPVLAQVEYALSDDCPGTEQVDLAETPSVDEGAFQANCGEEILAWLGPAFYQQSLAGSNGPWLEIFVNTLGPTTVVLEVLCDLFPPPAPTPSCPT